MNDVLIVAGSIGIFLVIFIAWVEARICAQIAEDEARTNRRQVILSRSFRRGGVK